MTRRAADHDALRASLRSEDALLVACARASLDADQRGRVHELVRREIDWALLSKSATWHGVAPLVYHTLTSAGAIATGDPRISALETRFFANAGNGLVLARELNELLTALDHAGVRAVPYKGPALAAALYGNVALREFSDLDVLVTPDAVATTRALLVLHGYEVQLPLSVAQERALVTSKSEYSMRLDRLTRAGHVALELHWRFPAPFPLDDDGMWRRVRPATIAGHTRSCLATEDLLLVLSAHGYKHAWNTLKWVSDLHQLIATHAIDWDVALDRAREQGGTRVLLLGCALTRVVLGTPLPAPVVARIDADPIVGVQLEGFTHRLFEQRLQRTGVMRNLRIRERHRDRLDYSVGLVSHLFVPTVAERASWRLPPGAGFVHYLAHPIRLAARFVRKYGRRT